MTDDSMDIHESDKGESALAAGARQLSIPLPASDDPPLVQTVTKRDGREAPYETHKIAEAIFRAAQGVGAEDIERARGIARGVTLYLGRRHGTHVPSVDLIQEAVERALRELGHARTALAIVRYREKRERGRRLRSARPGTAGARGPADTNAWGPDRIASGLMRDSGLDEERARMIAEAVSGQIQRANIAPMNAALLRELVDAKLTASGLDEHRESRRKIGVPLAEAEQIICAPHDGRPGTAFDPESTNRMLAERVKREFALTRVFPARVSEAHRGGEIHLHGLGKVDRLRRMGLPLGYVKRHGLLMADGRRASLPARRPDVLVAQLAGFTSALGSHFSEAVHWEAVNYYLAPFIGGMSADAMKDLARVLVYEFAYRALSHGDLGGSPEIFLATEVPDHLRDVEAIGPGGESTGRRYSEFAPEASQMGQAILRVYRGLAKDPDRVPAPRIGLRVSPSCLDRPGHRELVRSAIETAIDWGEFSMRIDRDDPMLPHAEDAYSARETVAHQVTLNLARAAFHSASESDFVDELDRLADLAAAAHVAKRDFIARLLAANRAGPLALLGIRRDGAPLFDLNRATFSIGFTGLNEGIEHLTGSTRPRNAQSVEMAERAIGRLQRRCNDLGQALGIHLALTGAVNGQANRRLAESDLADIGMAARAVIAGGPDSEASYVPGVRLNPSEDPSPMERIYIEGRLHPLLSHGATVELSAGDLGSSAGDFDALVTEAIRATACRGIDFVRRESP